MTSTQWGVWAAAAGAAALYQLKLKHELQDDCRVSCCGIIGYTGPQDAERILKEGIQLLQNRGYDSCGMTTINQKKLITTKFASHGSTSDSVDSVTKVSGERHKDHKTGIAHTRWATHGAKSDVNAHPHHDYKNRIALVHNGTIDNYLELKDELINSKIPFMSETDSEVIANLIAKYLDTGLDFETATKKAVGRLRGTWGLLITHKDHPNGFMVARNGSPILLSAGGKELFVASEPLAMARYTNQYISLGDGECAYVTASNMNDVMEGKSVMKIPHTEIELSPAPFKRWTLKEIYEQPKSLSRATNHGARLFENKVTLGGLEDNKKRLLEVKNLLITGCGTSLFAGLYGELLMRHLEAFDNVNVIDASEVDRDKFARPYEHSGILALSQSGETRDTLNACNIADDIDVTKISIVNSVGSLLARTTGCGIYLNAGREVAVASTKAFTSQVVCLALAAGWFAQNRGPKHPQRILKLAENLHTLPALANKCLQLDGQCRKIAASLKDAKTMFVLGKGWGYPVALEGALKIKEISYLHAEGFGGGQLKHGPFALLDPDQRTPVIMLILKDSNKQNMMTAAQEIKARHARTVIITDDPESVKHLSDNIIPIPSNGVFTALLATIPLQLIAYHLADLKGLDPDKPRGLAKTVTVD